MSHFTPLSSLIGGALIGLAASLLLLTNGRIAGISGIAGGILSGYGKRELSWRLTFLIGLVGAGWLIAAAFPEAVTYDIVRSRWSLIAAGLLVGIGTRVGNGCTSGHGVCGISRLSPRSMVATATFIFFGVAAVTIVRHFLGGVL